MKEFAPLLALGLLSGLNLARAEDIPPEAVTGLSDVESALTESLTSADTCRRLPPFAYTSRERASEEDLEACIERLLPAFSAAGGDLSFNRRLAREVCVPITLGRMGDPELISVPEFDSQGEWLGTEFVWSGTMESIRGAPWATSELMEDCVRTVAPLNSQPRACVSSPSFLRAFRDSRESLVRCIEANFHFPGHSFGRRHATLGRSGHPDVCDRAEVLDAFERPVRERAFRTCLETLQEERYSLEPVDYVRYCAKVSR